MTLRLARFVFAFVSLAASCAADSTEDAHGSRHITIAKSEIAGLSGLAPLWNTPIPLAENGAEQLTLAEPGRTDYGEAPTLYWLPEHRKNGKTPGGLGFDALLRSILVKFPTAPSAIAATAGEGYRIKRILLILPYRGTEFWPEYYRPPPWLSRLGGAWKSRPPRWHAIAWLVKKPWANDPQLGPTFNASINGVAYWEKYGAQGAADRFTPSFQTEVSSVHGGTIDLTAAIVDDTLGLGGTLAERLALLANCGLLIRKVETYDASYYDGGYETGTMTGQRAILIGSPRLEIDLDATSKPSGLHPNPSFDLATTAARIRKDRSGGRPTAVIPDEKTLGQYAREYGFVQPKWMPDWQWRNVQTLRAIPSVGGFSPDVTAIVPGTTSQYTAWLDRLLSIEPRRWAGFDAVQKATLYLRDAPVLPDPVKDHLKLYWESWLMPFFSNWRGMPNGYVDAVTPRKYYERTGDWRGDFSLYRTYVHNQGPQDFNHWAVAGVLLGGAIIGSQPMMAEGRSGLEDYPLRTWSWADGSTQESIDHYYFAITLRAQKAFADYGPTPYDRLMGQTILAKSIEELASLYHPALRRFISTSGRTSPAYLFGTQDGLQHIVHTLSRRGALTDLGASTVTSTHVKALPVIGHDVLPVEVAEATLDGPWAPEWFTPIVDDKPLPYESRILGNRFLETSYLGRNYGLASGDDAPGTVPFLAQWRRTESIPASLTEIGTLLVRYGANRTEFLDTLYHGTKSRNPNGIVGMQGGYVHTVQLRNKAIVLSTPTGDLVTDRNYVLPAAISSLQTSIALYDFSAAPGWELYVDAQRVTRFPASLQFGQRITVRDGVTYIGILPLPGTNLGRNDDVVLSTGGTMTELQPGGWATEALRIDAYNFQAAKPVPRSTLDSAALDAAWGGYIIEFGDRAEYGDFAAFQRHIAGAELTIAPGRIVSVRYRSGADRISTGFDPAGAGSLIEPLADGETVALPNGIFRDTTLSQIGRTGRLQKLGATLATTPGVMSYLVVEPTSHTYSGSNALPDRSQFSLTTPEHAGARTDGEVEIFRAVLQPLQGIATIDFGFKDPAAPTGRAAAVLLSGFATTPAVALNGVPISRGHLLRLQTKRDSIYVVPLSGRFDPDFVARYKDDDHNGLPDAWERKWFGHVGVDPSGPAKTSSVWAAFVTGQDPK